MVGIGGVWAGIRTSHPPMELRSVAASASLFVRWHQGTPWLYFGRFENRKLKFFPRLQILSNAIFHGRVFTCTSLSSTSCTRVSTCRKFLRAFLPTSLLYVRCFFFRTFYFPPHRIQFHTLLYPLSNLVLSYRPSKAQESGTARRNVSGNIRHIFVTTSILHLLQVVDAHCYRRRERTPLYWGSIVLSC